MPKAKNAPIKKVVVTRHGQSLKPAEKPVYAHQVQLTCQGSAVYNGSTELQGELTSWVTAADLVGANLAKQEVARNTLTLLEEDLPALVLACDNAEAKFGTSVQEVAKDDVTVATGMGVSVKADKAPAPAVVVPTALEVTRIQRTNAWKLSWKAVPGALLYLAQMSVDPATETSWVPLYGKGKSRTLPPLVPGQHYVLRVATLDNEGRPTGWSVMVNVIG